MRCCYKRSAAARRARLGLDSAPPASRGRRATVSRPAAQFVGQRIRKPPPGGSQKAAKGLGSFKTGGRMLSCNRRGLPYAVEFGAASPRPATRSSRPARLLRRRHHEIGQRAGAVRAPEPQLDQRHVATAGVDQGPQVGIAPMAAGLAPHQHPDIARPQRGARRRQFVLVGAHRRTVARMEQPSDLDP